jgi:hypothetical protein
MRDRLPVRAAVVVPDEAATRYKGSFSIGPHVYDFDLDLGTSVREALVHSLTQAVDRVAVVRAVPPAGAYQLVLVPRLTERALDGWTDWGRLGIGVQFSVGGARRSRAGRPAARRPRPSRSAFHTRRTPRGSRRRPSPLPGSSAPRHRCSGWSWS